MRPVTMPFPGTVIGSLAELLRLEYKREYESELARKLTRSRKLRSELEAIKRALRENENRVTLLAHNGGGDITGATMSVELNTVSDASMSADNILDLNCSPEAKIGDFGNGHEDDVETPTEEAVDMLTLEEHADISVVITRCELETRVRALEKEDAALRVDKQSWGKSSTR